MTTYIVEYQKAFGAGAMPEEKEFFDEDEAKWFERALKRSNYITKLFKNCLLYTSPSPRDRTRSRMPSSA